LLFLGTVTPLVYIPAKKMDWGFAQWAKSLARLMLDGFSGLRTINAKRFLENTITASHLFFHLVLHFR